MNGIKIINQDTMENTTEQIIYHFCINENRTFNGQE